MITEMAKKAGAPLHSFYPAPPAADRKTWEALAPDLRKRLIKNGEDYLYFDYPLLLATDYMEFARTGNRSGFEAKQFARRIALDALVLAECVEHNGRFMDAIVNGLYLICEETAWQLPAHNSYVRDTPQVILPDVTRPVIDLFAAETGAVLAVAEYLLFQELEAISPSIPVMIERRLEDSIITPYLNTHFWWMGDGMSPMNNWTVWCTQNVLLTAFTRPLVSGDTAERILAKASQSIDYFLAEYGEDGCCDEGAQYYRHAGLCLFNCLEVLNGVTGNAFSEAFEAKKVKNIASYILNVHIDTIYYVNFADCSPVAGRCNAREFLFGKRTGNPELMAFAASDYLNSEDPLTAEEHNLFYRLQTIFTHDEMVSFDRNLKPAHRDIYYESVGIFAARDEHLYLAVKAGDNEDSHNHNDTGSFIVYKDGQPLIIDVGVETYTKKTFSPKRYEIWTMQSCYHNLPTFYDGETKITQMNGKRYRAVHVSHEFHSDECRISMDIAQAYPSEPMESRQRPQTGRQAGQSQWRSEETRIRSYVRTAVLKKGRAITITDHYEGTCSPVVLSLMVYEEPVIHQNTIAIGSLGICAVEGASHIERELVPITDPRLSTAWKHDIYRCLITMEAKDLTFTIY